MDLSGILLVSDLDGTLIGENFVVPQRNLDAIARFQQEGGSFAIATGRSILSGGHYAELTHPKGPCICLNGTILYDYTQQKMLWDCHLDQRTAAEYIQRLYDRFPTAGIEYFCIKTIHILRRNAYVTEHLNHEGVSWKEGPPIDPAQPWYKALFADDPEKKDALEAFSATFPHPGVRFVSSSENYLEMLPEQASKGNALVKAAELAGFRMENVYAIGDYYNDTELLEAAGVSVVPENAPDDLKEQADLVVGHCYQGAVADLIVEIERRHR